MTEPDAPGGQETVGVRVYVRERGREVDSAYDWDGRLWASEAIALYKVAGITPKEMLTGTNERDPASRQAFLWLLRKFRYGEDKLRLSEVDFVLASWRFATLNADGAEVTEPDEPDDDGADDAAADGPGNPQGGPPPDSPDNNTGSGPGSTSTSETTPS